jgi:hypothetical protein
MNGREYLPLSIPIRFRPDHSPRDRQKEGNRSMPNPSAQFTRSGDPSSGRSSPPSVSNIPAFVLALIWLVALPMVFYVFHKPLPPPALERLRNILIDLLGAGWIFWIGAGMGWRFVRKADISRLEKIALAEAAGLGIMSLLILGMAWANILYAPAVIVFFIFLTLLTSTPILRGIVRAAKAPWPGLRLANGFSVFLGLFAALSLLLSLGIALCPPLAWDALVYHLQIPKQILAAHSLSFPGDSLYREMPQIVEMLYAAAIALTGRAETAAVVGWGIGLTALAGITGIARRWGLRYSLFPAALLLAGDTLARSMGWGYTDWAAAFFGVAALSALSRKEEGARWLFLAGVFAGFALGTKYTAGALVVVLCLALASFRGWRTSFKEVAIVLVGCAAAFSPWIVRGLVFWGNPLPPILDAGVAGALRMRFFTVLPPANGPLLMAVVPLLQSTVGSYGTAPFGATIGPLLFAFLPGALVPRKEENPTGGSFLKLFWLCVIVYWAAAGAGALFSVALTQPRVYLALFPGIALLSARGFEGLWTIRLAKIRLGALAAVLAVLAMSVQAVSFGNSWVASGVPNFLAGTLAEREYLENNLGWHAPAMEMVRSLHEGSRVLMLWEPRGFYCGEKCRADAGIDRWYLGMRLTGSAEAALAEWRREGWTYVLIFDTGADFERKNRKEYSPSDWTELDRLRSMLTPVPGFADGYSLYSIPP